MVKIVYYKEKFLDESGIQGGLIAVNPTGKMDVLKKDFTVANFNSPKQVIISYTPDNLNEIKHRLKQHKIPFLILKRIIYPFHSQHLAPVKERLYQKIVEMNIKISEPYFPVMFFHDNEIVTRSNYKNFDFIKILADGFTDSVNFDSAIRKSYASKIRTFIEISTAESIVEMVPTILSNQEHKAYFALDLIKRLGKKDKSSLEKIPEELLNSKFFKFISTAIAKATGYKVEEINISDSFQQDLGIDSIKKAEIFFEILKSQNITLDENAVSLLKAKSVVDLVQVLENFSTKAPDSLANKTSTLTEVEINNSFKLYEKSTIPCNNLCLTPKKLDPAFTVVSLSQFESTSGFKLSENEKNIFIVNNLTNFSIDSEIEQRLVKLIEQLQHFFNNHTVEKLIFISYSDSSSYLDALNALFKSLKAEAYFTFYKFIKTEAFTLNQGELNLKNYYSEFSDYMNSEVFYDKNSNRHIVTLTEKETMPPTTFNSEKKAVTLISLGGSRGIGHAILKNLINHADYPIKLILIGKSNRSELKQNLDELQTNPQTTLTYQELDVNDSKKLESYLATLTNDGKTVDHLFIFTGIEISKSFKIVNQPEIASQINSKLAPLITLNHLKNLSQIQQITVASSIVSHFGNEGQAVYACANELIKQYVETNKKLLAKTKVIHWPAWNSPGMASKEWLLTKFKAIGLNLLSPETGADIFLKNLNSANSNFYPFSHFDYLIYQKSSINLDINGYFGTFVAKAGNTIKLRKTIDIEKSEAYLSAHSLDGKVLISCSYILTNTYLFFSAFFNRAFHLENICIENMLLLTTNTELNIEITKINNNYEVKFSTNVVHFILTVVLSRDNVPTNQIIKDEYGQTPPMVTFNFANLLRFKFEKPFRCLDTIDIYHNLQHAKLAAEAQDTLFFRVLKIFEGTMQVLFVDLDDKNKTLIPVHIAKVKFDFDNSIFGQIDIFSQLISSENRKFTCHSDVIDSTSNRIILSFTHFTKYLI